MTNRKFTIYDKSGIILQTGSYPAEDYKYLEQGLKPGEFLGEFESDIQDDLVDPKTGELLRGKAHKEPSPAEYIRTRNKSYPSVQEQLDMLWKAMNSGEIPKALDFYNSIKLVKDSIPKDDSVTIKPILFNVKPIPGGT